jgi:hypothetical protein
MAPVVIALATTIVDVYRDANAPDPGTGEGGDVDAWGDEIETPAPDTSADTDTDPDPYLRGIPASIIEQTQRVRDDAGGLRPVRFVVGRVSGRSDVQSGDRIRDRKNGAWYAVTATDQPQSPVIELDLRLELSRVSAS